MASCMALKRSFEHDRDSSSNNPYESRTPSPSSKRQRRCFPVTVVSSSSPPSATTMNNDIITTESSTVFPDVQPIFTTGKSANLFFSSNEDLLLSDDLLNRIKEEVRRLQRRHQLKPATTADVSDDDNPSESRSSNNQQPLLTLKQVNIICARLLKEREEKIREEYDQILSTKLDGIHQRNHLRNSPLLLFFFSRTIRRLRSIYTRSIDTTILRITILL